MRQHGRIALWLCPACAVSSLNSSPGQCSTCWELCMLYEQYEPTAGWYGLCPELLLSSSSGPAALPIPLLPLPLNSVSGEKKGRSGQQCIAPAFTQLQGSVLPPLVLSSSSPASELSKGKGRRARKSSGLRSCWTDRLQAGPCWWAQSSQHGQSLLGSRITARAWGQIPFSCVAHVQLALFTVPTFYPWRGCGCTPTAAIQDPPMYPDSYLWYPGEEGGGHLDGVASRNSQIFFHIVIRHPFGNAVLFLFLTGTGIAVSLCFTTSILIADAPFFGSSWKFSVAKRSSFYNAY